jgi:hypothetical protein
MAKEALGKHVPLSSVLALPEREELPRLREAREADFPRVRSDLENRLRAAIHSLVQEERP